MRRRWPDLGCGSIERRKNYQLFISVLMPVTQVVIYSNIYPSNEEAIFSITDTIYFVVSYGNIIVYLGLFDLNPLSQKQN